MTRRRPRDFIQFADDTCASLFQQPFGLCDMRARMAQVEEFGRGIVLERSIIGHVAGIVNRYYPLPELITFYRRRQDNYYEHVRRGDFDLTNEKRVLISDIYGVCSWWLKPELRYPYGDVRLLRPLIGEVLIRAAEWERSPYPEYTAKLGEWYEALAPGGALYPSDEHLAYVARFEEHAEDIIWDNRGREYITIVNFPAPPNALPPTEWWCTQHVLGPRSLL